MLIAQELCARGSVFDVAARLRLAAEPLDGNTVVPAASAVPEMVGRLSFLSPSGHRRAGCHSSSSPLSPCAFQVVRYVMKGLFTALAFLQERQIVHRDIKGGNTMLTEVRLRLVAGRPGRSAPLHLPCL